MKLIAGEHAGFCFGVRRAVEAASDFAERRVPCATLGPLIHNPQEVERLQRAGVRCVNAPEEVHEGETLIIRSHGVSPQLMERAKARGVPIVDLTCPHVAHIHQLARQLPADRALVIVGEANHPEVQGIAGWCRGEVIVVSSPEEAESAALPEMATVVAQTTLRRETFEAVLAALRQRIPDLQVHRTICQATGQRQREAEALAGAADVTLVVGGRNSSNTRKLYEPCRAHCARTYLIETPEDIPAGAIHPEDTVALTAGASTPGWLLEAVKARALQLGAA